MNEFIFNQETAEGNEDHTKFIVDGYTFTTEDEVIEAKNIIASIQNEIYSMFHKSRKQKEQLSSFEKKISSLINDYEKLGGDPTHLSDILLQLKKPIPLAKKQAIMEYRDYIAPIQIGTAPTRAKKIATVITSLI